MPKGISKKIYGKQSRVGFRFFWYVNLCSFSGFYCSSVDTARWLVARVNFTVRF